MQHNVRVSDREAGSAERNQDRPVNLLQTRSSNDSHFIQYNKKSGQKIQNKIFW